MFQELPNLHPMIVHFPIALAIIALVIDVIWIIRKQEVWLHRTAVLLYSLAAIGAIAAFISGRVALETVSIPALARTVLSSHENLGLYTMWSLIIYGGVRALFLFINVKPYIKQLLVVPAFGIIVLISITADRGGELVYAHGVGVAAAQNEPIPTAGLQADDAPIVDERGTVYWRTGRNSHNYFPLIFHPLKGADVLQPAIAKDVTPGDTVLSLELLHDAAALWVAGRNIDNVQLTGILNASKFNGTFALVYNVLDVQSYDFVRFEENSAIMGRFENGSERIFDDKTVELSEWHQIQVVSSGTHLYAYIDEEMIAHWHGPVGSPGRTGIYINGTGKLYIKEWIIEEI